MAPAKGTTEALAKTRLSKLNHMAFGFATGTVRSMVGFVTFVTLRNARLASGRWSNATGRAFHPQGHNRRFQIHFMSILLLRQVSWRNPFLLADFANALPGGVADRVDSAL